MSNSSQQTLSVPAAILAGAVIIGISIVIAFGSKGDGPSLQATNNGTQPTSESARLDIASAAKQVGVKAKAFETCLAGDEAEAAVEADSTNAVATGGRGTPHSILIGPGGKTLALSGAQPLENWNQAIDQLLSDGYATPEGDPSANVTPVGADEPVRGNPDAPITIVEYSDIDCPFCQRVHPVIAQVIADRPDDVNWVYRHFPLTQLHPDAKNKAIASECVAELKGADAYWEYLDLLITG